ncbi:Asp23/Gls24 family envelope stress response protein [Spiroplasma chrysopicola]|uniref:Asp23/Gls24 family envelope stress response protein n=1 Tax=Spiroplasma chrysopicola DF-1 TaxID=1276227 RepID=R4UBQ1_9MOLU|nr:Asp23/Gls24 family envelope stress response protein [Spiroplasma chrysopicola]AGM25344.1 hypothetical protein SCHRY_v1c07680 [Spiroplasma chrysopicola DF-1]
MEKNSFESIANIVYSAVITVPGVAGFARLSEDDSDEESATLLITDYSQSIKLKQVEGKYVIDIFLILLEGSNIRDVSQEVQIRIKYELEKLDSFPTDFIVNVHIQDLLV